MMTRLMIIGTLICSFGLSSVALADGYGTFRKADPLNPYGLTLQQQCAVEKGVRKAGGTHADYLKRIGVDLARLGVKDQLQLHRDNHTRYGSSFNVEHARQRTILKNQPRSIR
jgi:hypothetical protein